MEIFNPTTGFQVKLELIKNSLLESLHEGQIVQARAITSTRDDQLQLRIGRVEVQVQTQVRITAGESLTLQVIKTADPLEFKLVRPATDSAPNPPVRAEAMRSVLTQQRPVTELMQRLHAPLQTILREVPSSPTPSTSLPPSGHPSIPLLQTTATENTVLGGAQVPKPPLPQPIAEIIAVSAEKPTRPMPMMPGSEVARISAAIQRLLSFEQTLDVPLTGERIRQGFVSSGLFLESNLANAMGKPPEDMKSTILQLLQLMRPQLTAAKSGPTQRPPSAAVEQTGDHIARILELVTQVEGGVARIVFNQLSSLPSEDSNQQLWQFDLPFRHQEKSDNFQVQIQKERKPGGKEGATTRWSVKLDFDLTPSGPVTARLTLLGEEISGSFTAQQPETARRIDQALPQLATAFTRVGLRIGSLTAVRGETISPPRSPFPLLDERA
ncbi:MAG: flagellar hook-length control protein FliK [Gammaproteobacteria bacterium]|nr:flagellar hook-length control protein FliK [Gammaproteobacteria bacterium]